EPPCVVVWEDHPTYSAFHIVIGDRPFVVNTINECIRSFGLTTPVFLHPVLLNTGRRISLSYVETEKVSMETAEMVQRRLRKSMQELILVTEDFTSMLVRAETLAKILEHSEYRSTFPESERREVAEFLRWLSDGSFIFLGHAQWRLGDKEQIANTPAS